MKKNVNFIALSLATVFLTTACGEKKVSDVGYETVEVKPNNQISLTANDGMQYSASEFTVKKGEPITLILKNVGSMPKDGMGHNIVVLKENSSVSDFAREASAAGDQEYVPAALKESILANSKLLGPGESDTIVFTIDKSGEYPFLCSFPGHFASMNGKINVVD